MTIRNQSTHERAALLGSATLLASCLAFSAAGAGPQTATPIYYGQAIVDKILSELEGVVPIDRTSMNAFEDDAFREAVQATGRKRLIIGGLHTEIQIRCIRKRLQLLEAQNSILGEILKISVPGCGIRGLEKSIQHFRGALICHNTLTVRRVLS